MPSDPVRALLLGLVLVTGCKPEPHFSDAMPPPDAPLPWWHPKPGEAADWDIQLAASPFAVTTPRAMYVIDLWDAVPAGTPPLDYGDGMPLTVPVGAHAGAIAQLRALVPPPIVVCHVGTGAIRLDDPDAVKFPGYKPDPPNRPDPLDPGSVIGYGLMDDPNVRFIDIHEDSRGVVVPLIAKRFELAKTLGCDAVAAELHDLLSYQANPGHGFENLQPSDYTSWSTAVTERAHGLTLSIGLRSSTAMGVDGMARLFDWLLIERCGELDDCDTSRSFIDLDRAVFAIEFDLDLENMPNMEAIVCGNLAEAGIADGIIKTAELSSTPPVKRCTP